MTRLTISPEEWASRYFIGSTWILRIAAARMSSTTRNVRVLFTRFMIQVPKEAARITARMRIR